MVPSSEAATMTDDDIFKACEKHGAKRVYDAAYPREVAEAALAHKLPDAVERACQRGTLWPKRVLLMDAWGSYCDKPRAATAKVVPIKRRTAR
jgi:hypothetical protein